MTTDTRAALERATVRLEILQDRMRGCPAHEADSVHDLSIFEIEGWIEEQRDLLALSAPEERGEGEINADGEDELTLALWKVYGWALFAEDSSERQRARLALQARDRLVAANRAALASPPAQEPEERGEDRSKTLLEVAMNRSTLSPHDFDAWLSEAAGLPPECKHGVRRGYDCGLCDLGNGFETAPAQEPEPMFKGIPESWWDAGLWRCENGHVSRMKLKSDTLGHVCLSCGSPVRITHPDDTDDPVPSAPPVAQGAEPSLDDELHALHNRLRDELRFADADLIDRVAWALEAADAERAQGAEEPFVSASCDGEACALCDAPATMKIGEEIMHDDPMPNRHNLTQYVCARHAAAIFHAYRFRDGQECQFCGATPRCGLCDTAIPLDDLAVGRGVLGGGAFICADCADTLEGWNYVTENGVPITLSVPQGLPREAESGSERYEVYRADNGYWYVYEVRTSGAGFDHRCLTNPQARHITADSAWRALSRPVAGSEEREYTLGAQRYVVSPEAQAALHLALENCRSLAEGMARRRGGDSEWDHVLRFCEVLGPVSVLRAALRGEEVQDG